MSAALGGAPWCRRSDEDLKCYTSHKSYVNISIERKVVATKMCYSTNIIHLFLTNYNKVYTIVTNYLCIIYIVRLASLTPVLPLVGDIIIL